MFTTEIRHVFFNFDEKMKALCEKLISYSEIKSAKFSYSGILNQYSLQIIPKKHCKSTTIILKSIIKKEFEKPYLANTGISIINFISPIKNKNIVPIQYNQNYWSFKVDFHIFNSKPKKFNKL